MVQAITNRGSIIIRYTFARKNGGLIERPLNSRRFLLEPPQVSSLKGVTIKRRRAFMHFPMGKPLNIFK